MRRHLVPLAALVPSTLACALAVALGQPTAVVRASAGAGASPTAAPTATAGSTATAAPTATATPAPRHPRVTLDPTSIPAGTGATVNVTASGFPSSTHLLVSWQTITGTAVLPGVPVYTDSSGYASRGEIVPRTVAPGPYRIVVAGVAGVPEASASITLEPPVGATGTPGEFCFIKCFYMGDAWKASTEGGLSWSSTEVQAGRGTLVTATVGLLTNVVDYTTSAWDGVWSLSSTFVLWGTALVGFASMLSIGWEAKRARRMHDAEKLFGLLVLVAFLLGAIGGLKGYEGALWRWEGAMVMKIGGDATASFSTALSTWTTITSADTASMAKWGLGLIAALGMLLVLGFQLVILGLSWLGVQALLVLLWLSGALCVATAALPPARGVALAWLRTLLTGSTVAIVWAWMLDGEGKVAAALASGAGESFTDVVLKIALGIVLVFAVGAAPEVTATFWRLAIPGAGGVWDITRTPLHRAAGLIKRRVPLVGRL